MRLPDPSTVTLAGGLTLSYVEQGDAGGAPLVLLPGPTDSWRSYASVLEQLPPSVRAFAVSQRGHGDSDKPRSGFGIDDFAADAVALLDALGLGRVVLAGHSGSCLVARRIALDHPDRVRGLILEASPTTLVGHAGAAAMFASVIAPLTDPISLEEARGFLVDTASDDLPAALVDDLAREAMKVPARAWHEMFGALLTYDDLSELDSISCPSLLVWGESDELIGRDVQEQLVSRLPDSDLRIYESCGHTPRWEAPARFAADVTAFVLGLPNREAVARGSPA